jgi:hypothetical protein
MDSDTQLHRGKALLFRHLQCAEQTRFALTHRVRRSFDKNLRLDAL